MIPDINYELGRDIGWGAVLIVVVVVPVIYGLSWATSTPYLRTRLISIPIELAGFVLFVWGLSSSFKLGVMAAIMCTLGMEVLFAIHYRMFMFKAMERFGRHKGRR